MTGDEKNQISKKLIKESHINNISILTKILENSI